MVQLEPRLPARAMGPREAGFTTAGAVDEKAVVGTLFLDRPSNGNGNGHGRSGEQGADSSGSGLLVLAVDVPHEARVV
ncbi:hypothetical protein GTY56_14880 [Streptomyces sp. SID5643]|nr:hypothetical protein [Streptomyces sp. SID5643]